VQPIDPAVDMPPVVLASAAAAKVRGRSLPSGPKREP